ncbi:hypothetical protein FQN57_006721 [Myotisia sp. PD_48]|nr:hypothetical protein FQN57_006721 [Myotisia sp. PD_48]
MARSPIPQLPGYHGLVLDAEQLAAHPCLPGLQALLNDSFNHRNMPMSPSATQGRFGELSAITSNFGFHGRCSVIFKCTRQALENGIDEAIPEVVSSSGDEKNGCDCGLRATQPIATAMMKYFNPEINGKAFDGPDIGEGIGYSSEPEDILSISHWEPSCVAISLSDPSLQGKGLATSFHDISWPDNTLDTNNSRNNGGLLDEKRLSASRE